METVYIRVVWWQRQGGFQRVNGKEVPGAGLPLSSSLCSKSQGPCPVHDLAEGQRSLHVSITRNLPKAMGSVQTFKMRSAFQWGGMKYNQNTVNERKVPHDLTYSWIIKTIINL